MQNKMNILLDITYNGSHYFGWQKQKDKPTIQGEIESALQKIFKQKIKITGAGRTDTGVNAIHQICNFLIDTATVDTEKLMFQLNGILPPEIRINLVRIVPLTFNSAVSAIAREYIYLIYIDRIMPPFLKPLFYHYPFEIDIDILKKSIKVFKGTHDFSSFTVNPQTDKKIYPVKTILKFDFILNYKGLPAIAFIIKANGFLRKMVRRIIGTVLELNKLKQNPEIIKEIFKLKNPSAGGPVLPPYSLFLYKVYYPESVFKLKK